MKRRVDKTELPLVRLCSGAGKRLGPNGVCVMELTHALWLSENGYILTDETILKDLPPCTERTIARCSMWVNDTLRDVDERQRLKDLVPRLLRALKVQDEMTREIVLRRLAMWAVEDAIERKKDTSHYMSEEQIELFRRRGKELDPETVVSDIRDLLAPESSSWTNPIDLVDWLDSLLEQYDKIRADEGVLLDELSDEAIEYELKMAMEYEQRGGS